MPEIVSRKTCSVCGGRLSGRQAKTCGAECRSEYERRYQHAYHLANIGKRREYRRKHQIKYYAENKDAIRARRKRKTLTDEQKLRRQERKKRWREDPVNRAKESARRAQWREANREKWLEAKRLSYGRHRDENAEKRRQRHRKNPEHHIEYSRRYQRKMLAAWKIVKELAAHDDRLRSIIGELDDAIK